MFPQCSELLERSRSSSGRYISVSEIKQSWRKSKCCQIQIYFIKLMLFHLFKFLKRCRMRINFSFYMNRSILTSQSSPFSLEVHFPAATPYSKFKDLSVIWFLTHLPGAVKIPTNDVVSWFCLCYRGITLRQRLVSSVTNLKCHSGTKRKWNFPHLKAFPPIQCSCSSPWAGAAEALEQEQNVPPVPRDAQQDLRAGTKGPSPGTRWAVSALCAGAVVLHWEQPGGTPHFPWGTPFSPWGTPLLP